MYRASEKCATLLSAIMVKEMTPNGNLNPEEPSEEIQKLLQQAGS